LEGEDGGVRNHDGRWLCAPCGERHEGDKARALRRMARSSANPSNLTGNSHPSNPLSHSGARYDAQHLGSPNYRSSRD
jgi:hypothetical protein